MMHFGGETRIGQRREQYVVQINGQQFKESIAADRFDGVACVIGIGPCIRARCQTSIRQQIQNSFIRIQLRTEEDQMLQGVRQSIVIVCLGCCKFLSGESNTVECKRISCLLIACI